MPFMSKPRGRMWRNNGWIASPKNPQQPARAGPCWRCGLQSPHPQQGETCAMAIETFAFNVGTAVLLGVAIGLERQWGPHAAGLRVNALVALGAALFVGLSSLVDHESSPTR